MSAIVSLRSVTKAFGDTTAVNDVSLDIEEGEFFALLGPSWPFWLWQDHLAAHGVWL
jgi:ABC-type branched-subunit amino acid transport system ATPase component